MHTLQKGYIVIFKVEDDWLSKTIGMLTKSDVSHAAMAYSENTIVEVIAKGANLQKISASESGKYQVYVLRLASQPDPAPLIWRADEYLNAEVKYDFPGLVILAGLLIYRSITPTSRLLNIANRIIAAACVKLDDMIQHAIQHHVTRAMVCSQFVYQLFYDCGEPYRIQIPHDYIWNPDKQKDSCTVTLKGLIEPDMLSPTPENILLKENGVLDMEYPEKELYEALLESETNNAEDNLMTADSNSELSNTVLQAGKFLSLLKHFLTIIQCDTPMDAFFVTPGDIMYHSTNLERIAEFKIDRI